MDNKSAYKFRNCLDIFVKSFIPPCYAEIHYKRQATGGIKDLQGEKVSDD